MSFNTDPDRWFHGKITRENAAHLVSSGVGGRREGLFLVRESLRMPGSFVLTMWARNQVHHFQIVGHGDGWFSVDNGPLFQGLDDLVHHYQCRADGLPAQLNDFITGHPPPLSAMKRLETSLHRAVSNRDVVSVRRALSQQANPSSGSVDSQNGEGSTPVHEAAKKGYVEVLGPLLDHKPDLTIRDSKGSTSLQLAARNGHSDCIKLIVEKGGADVQERNATTGWVALHEAAFRGHVECVKVLLQLNAPLRPRTPEEDTPKDLAARYKQREVLELLDWAALHYPKPRTTTIEWLHKATDRNKAVALLQKKGKADGSFLARPNSRRPGYYALTLVYNQMPYHYEIVCESDLWYFIDDGPLFDSLPAVVDHYMLFTDGLPTLLRFPVPAPGTRLPHNPGRPPPPPGQLLFSKTNMPAPVRGYKPPIPAPSTPPPPSSSHLTSPPVPNPRPPHHAGGAAAAAFNGTRGPIDPPPPGYPPGPHKPMGKDKDPYQMVAIKADALSLGDELGQGEFGSVLRGEYRTPDGKIVKVAVKTLRVDAMGHGEKEFMREAGIMITLNHPCIVKLIGVTRGKPMMLVQELIPHGALVDYLYEGKYPRPSITTLTLWAAEIASGMTYLERKRFVHRDLAARNILVFSEKMVKISDFGLSRAVGANSDYYKASQGGRWPVKWYAPESINYGTFSHASDIWSYGITLWEMFSYGEPPYGEMTGAEVLDMIENNNFRLDKPPGCPNSIYQVMLSCWNLEPANRPSFVQLHQTFSESPEYREISSDCALYQSPGDL